MLGLDVFGKGLQSLLGAASLRSSPIAVFLNGKLAHVSRIC